MELEVNHWDFVFRPNLSNFWKKDQLTFIDSYMGGEVLVL